MAGGRQPPGGGGGRYVARLLAVVVAIALRVGAARVVCITLPPVQWGGGSTVAYCGYSCAPPALVVKAPLVLVRAAGGLLV